MQPKLTLRIMTAI